MPTTTAGAAEGKPGWSFTEVLAYLKRAEHNTRGADAWRGSGAPLQVQDLGQPRRRSAQFVAAARQAGQALDPDFNGATQQGAGPYQVTHRNGERGSAAKAYLTQLPMLSGVGPAAHLQALGMRVLHDLPSVGANRHEHVDVLQVVDVRKVTELFGLSLAGLRNAIAGMPEWRNHRSRPLTSHFAEAGGFAPSLPQRPAPDLQLHFVIGKRLQHGRSTVFEQGYSCHVCPLNFESWVSVTLASADPLAAPP